jgi:CheY-like chemotaxis protein
MKRSGDIIIIEDDPDDWEVLIDVFKKVMKEQKYDNRVIVFEDSTMVLEYLNETDTELFMVISDINMPLLDGMKLRESICADPKLHKRCTPYIFLTTGAVNKNNIAKAEELSVQGFFEKPASIKDYKLLVEQILGYWQKTIVPQ